MVVEELIGKLTFRADGFDKAKQAAKTMRELRAALKSLSGTARMRLDGPAQAVKKLKELMVAAKKAEEAQKRLASGVNFGRANAGAERHLGIVKRLSVAYREAAASARALTVRPTGRSWVHGEIAALRQYQAALRAAAKEAARIGPPSGSGRWGGGRRALPSPNWPTTYGPRYRDNLPKDADERVARTVPGSMLGVGQERARQTAAGMTEAEKRALEVRAREISKRYPSLGSTEVETLGRTARNAMPNYDTALGFLEDMAQLQVSLQNTKGIDEAREGVSSLIKALDNMGRLEDPEQARGIIQGMTRALNVEGKDLLTSSLFTTAKYAKSAGATLSAQYLTTDVPTLGQDMGPSQLGTALGTMISQMIGGRATVKSKAQLESLGLADWALGGASREEMKKRKEFGFTERGVNDPKLLSSDPTEWARKHMIPALQKKGVDLTDESAVVKEMAQAFSAQTVANFWTKTITQMPQLMRNRELYAKAQSGDQAAQTAGKDNPFVAIEGAVQSFLNIFRPFGDTFSSVVAKVANAISNFNNSIGDWVAKDPTTNGALVAGGAAAGVAAGAVAKGRIIRKAGKRLLGAAAGAGGAATGAAATGAAGGAAAGVAAGATAAVATKRGILGTAKAIAKRGLGIALRAIPGAGLAVAGAEVGKALLDDAPSYPSIDAVPGRKALDPGVQERALRDTREKQRDPEGFIGRERMRFPPPQIDMGAAAARLSEIKGSAEALQQDMQFKGSVTIDSSALDALSTKIDTVKAKLAGLGGAVSGAAGRAGSVLGASAPRGFSTPTAGTTAP